MGRRRLRDASLRGGGAYGTSPITGRRRLRDEPPYGTSLLTGRRRWDEPPYTGRRQRRLREEPPYGTERCAYGTSLLTDGGAFGTLTGRASLRGGTHGRASLHRDESLTGRRRLRDEPLRRRLRGERPYGPEALAGLYTGRPLTARAPRALRDQPTAFTGRPITGRNCFLTDGRHLQNEPPYGPGALTGRRVPDGPRFPTSLWDAPFTAGRLMGRAGQRRSGEAPYGAEALTGRVSGRTRGGGLRDEPLYGTSLLAGRRRWDEPPYGPEAEALTGRASLRDCAYGTSLLTDGGAFGDPYGTSLLARRHSRTSFLTPGRVPHGPEALTGRALTEALTGRASLRAGGAYGPLYRTAPYRATPAGSEGVTGTSLLAGPTAFYGDPLRDEIASLQTGGAHKTSLRITGRRRLRDEPRASGAYGTSLLTGRRCWDEPRYGTSLLTQRRH